MRPYICIFICIYDLKFSSPISTFYEMSFMYLSISLLYCILILLIIINKVFETLLYELNSLLNKNTICSIFTVSVNLHKYL